MANDRGEKTIVLVQKWGAGKIPIGSEFKLSSIKKLGKGIITIDGVEYEMNPRDGIYIGMGNKEITFKCVDTENPPKFYVSSCPAHTSYPIVKIALQL